MRTAILLLLCLINVVPQERDHPKDALVTLRAQFAQEQTTANYPRMLLLMDQIARAERSIDYRSAAKIRTEFESYASLFSATAQGRAVYRLYMQQMDSPSYARDVVAALQPDKEALLQVPYTPYRDVLRLGYSSGYPCTNLYEAALFIQLEQQPDSTLYDAFAQLYSRQKGNYPANHIYTLLHQWRFGTFTQSQRLQRVDSLITRYADYEPVTLAILEKAQLLIERGADSKDPKQAEALYKQTRALCVQALRDFPSSPQKKHLKNIIQSLEDPRFSFTVNEQTHPHAPLKVVVSHTNTPRIVLKILNDKGRRIFKKKYSGLDTPLNLNVADTFLLPTPPEGSYRLQVTYKKNTQDAAIYIGKVAGLFQGNRGQGHVYAVDWLTGEPFPAVSLTFLPSLYDTPEEYVPLPSIDLAPNGFTEIPFTQAHMEAMQRRGLRMRVALAATADRACDSFSAPIVINRWNLGDEPRPQMENTAVSLFTDRKLYQPKDSIYFKGIMTRYSKGETHTPAGQKVSVYLSSQTSWQDTLAVVECLTNEFGSFSGAFATNEHMLNGMYRIYTQRAAVSVRLEQYVRPTFTIEMPALETVLAFGDTYTQKGHIQNTAGFPLSDATLTYTVTRAPLVRPYLWRYVPYFYEETEVASGTLRSNAQGDFEITFSTPRPVTDSKALCVFCITVQASDALGETHTAQQNVSVGDEPIVYQASVPSVAVKEQSPVLEINALNLNGKEQPIEVPFSLYLQGVKQFEGHTADGLTPQPQWDRLPSGAYTLRYGAQDSLQFTLFSLDDTLSPVAQPVFIYPLDGPVPAFMLGTRQEQIYVQVAFYDGDSLCFQQVITHKKGLHRYDFPAVANYSAPLTLKTVSVWHGQCFTHNHTYAPPAQPPLTLVLRSFRNLVLPNSQTTLSLQLSPHIPAELLLSVYNASTDRLGSNSFAWTPAHGYKTSVRSLQKQFDAKVSGRQYKERMLYAEDAEVMMMADGMVKNRAFAESGPLAVAQSATEVEEEQMSVIENDADRAETQAEAPTSALRTDFAETLAFLPHLQTEDSTGLFTAQVATNGLLSTFRVLAMAHTRDGRYASLQDAMTVRKEVMVMPSFPAFLREGDSIDLGAKVVNLTSVGLQARAGIDVNGTSLGWKSLLLPEGGQQNLRWPYRVGAVTDLSQPQELTLLAQIEAPQHHDAQQNHLPVLPRRQQVVRAQTLLLKAGGMQTLRPLSAGSTLQCEATTPVVAALSALPSFTAPAGNNLLASLAAYFAQTTGSRLLSDNPQLVAWIRNLPQGQAAALQGKENLTQIYLEETPWLAYRQSEGDRIRTLLTLTDSMAVQQMQQQAWNTFAALQLGNGAMSWFPGMGASYSLTLYFLEQMGDLAPYPASAQCNQIIARAVKYVDQQFAGRYPSDVRKKLKKGEVPYDVALFFYVRSAYAWLPYSEEVQQVVDFFAPAIDKAWEGKTVMEKAYWAMTYRRMGHSEALAAVMRSLRQYAVKDPAMGCFFPNAVGENGLMSSQLRAHALLLQLFAKESSMCIGLQQWLLLQKKNHIWDNESSTARVITALIETGGLQVPNFELIPSGRSFIIKNRSNTPLFASLYEQTFENLDQVEAFANEMGVTRAFFRNGIQLKAGDVLHPGERLTARYELSNTQDRSFVQLQALRAACLTPTDETSSYHWAHRCGYYREVKASATNYFFQELTSGEHTIEEGFYVTQSGVFQDGWAKVQCLYAPEYRGHSAVGRLQSVAD